MGSDHFDTIVLSQCPPRWNLRKADWAQYPITVEAAFITEELLFQSKFLLLGLLMQLKDVFHASRERLGALPFIGSQIKSSLHIGKETGFSRLPAK